jgi:hypothetical protein
MSQFYNFIEICQQFYIVGYIAICLKLRYLEILFLLIKFLAGGVAELFKNNESLRLRQRII